MGIRRNKEGKKQVTTTLSRTSKVKSSLKEGKRCRVGIRQNKEGKKQVTTILSRTSNVKSSLKKESGVEWEYAEIKKERNKLPLHYQERATSRVL